MSCMAISNCRCSTRITMSAASCPSTSMTPRPLGQWRCCCGPARPHQDRRYAVICDACCAPSGSTGHTRTSPFAVTAHYGRPEVMEWCDENGIDFVFGLAGNDVLRRLVEPVADDVRVRRAEAGAAAIRCYTETRYGAKSWHVDRRVVARIEATTQGLDIRYVVTSLAYSRRQSA